MASLAEKLAAKRAAEEASKQTSGAAAKTVFSPEVKDPPKEEEKKTTAVVSITKLAAEAIKNAPVDSNLTVEQTDARSSSELIQKIKQLQEMSGEDLTNAMKDLKESLHHNPSACEILLPEDVGMVVEALRKITGQAITEATTKKPAKAKTRALTKEEMEQAFDEL